MGYYINKVKGETAPTTDKAEFLRAHAAAREIPRPSALCPDLVCVVSNGFFDAAAYVYSPAELAEFSQDTDPRPRKWLIVPGAAELAGYGYAQPAGAGEKENA